MYIQILGPYVRLFTSQKVRESPVAAALLHVCLDNIKISPEVQIILSKLILRMQLMYLGLPHSLTTNDWRLCNMF